MAHNSRIALECGAVQRRLFLCQEVDALLVAGLTGGIASGKSTVSGILKRAGAYVLDADQIARRAVAPGQPALQAVARTFGPGVINADGSLDRKALGDLVFDDPALRRQLEQIIHPIVRCRMHEAVSTIAAADPDALIVQDVPLLLETGMQRGLDEIIVVYVPEDIQLQRLMTRDGIDRASALNRIRAQMPIETKRRMATIIIDNSASIADTERQTLRVYRELSIKAALAGPRK